MTKNIEIQYYGRINENTGLNLLHGTLFYFIPDFVKHRRPVDNGVFSGRGHNILIWMYPTFFPSPLMCLFPHVYILYTVGTTTHMFTWQRMNSKSPPKTRSSTSMPTLQRSFLKSPDLTHILQTSKVTYLHYGFTAKQFAEQSECQILSISYSPPDFSAYITRYDEKNYDE